MEAEYLAKGWELTDKHADADLFVVRGCSVTSRAQSESEHMVAHLRKHYPTVPVRVCGCLKDKDAAALARLRGRLPPGSQTSAALARATIPTRTARAYLKVQDGCNGRCTFCIVPQFRGKSSSVPFAELLDRAKRFIDSGYREIVVTGCNLSLYLSSGKRLPDLLAALADLAPEGDGRCRVRLGSLEPCPCAVDTVHAMAEHANVCRFLHVPVQSGSNRILLSMRRPYLVKDVEAIVQTATSLMPGIGLGCDLMTGFPGESDLDFSATKGLLERLPFSNAHVFPYSTRPHTVAAGLGGALPKEVRSSRAHALAKIAEEARERYTRTFVGKTVEIVVEREDKVIGWTSEYLKCEAVAGDAPRKSIARVFVTHAKDDALLGRLD